MLSEIEKDAMLAFGASEKLTSDLKIINQEWLTSEGVPAFVAIDSRVKTTDSILRKIYSRCTNGSQCSDGISREKITKIYRSIADVCGVRFSCTYHDEVLPRIMDVVRPRLTTRGYGTDMTKKHPDKDFLSDGDSSGYRSYHFFVNVPTPIDIYSRTKMMLCEVQARTELQHIWAVKSHNLLYKPDEGWGPIDENVKKDMKAVSDSLRSADQWLVSIRDRAKGAKQ